MVDEKAKSDLVVRNATMEEIAREMAKKKKPLVRLNKPNLLLLPPASDSVKLIQYFHRSLTSATEKFAGFLYSLASRKPLFQQAARLSSEFGVLCNEVTSLSLLLQIENAM